MVDVLPPVGAYPKWEVNGTATEGYITISVMQSGSIFVKQGNKIAICSTNIVKLYPPWQKCIDKQLRVADLGKMIIWLKLLVEVIGLRAFNFCCMYFIFIPSWFFFFLHWCLMKCTLSWYLLRHLVPWSDSIVSHRNEVGRQDTAENAPSYK